MYGQGVKMEILILTAQFFCTSKTKSDELSVQLTRVTKNKKVITNVNKDVDKLCVSLTADDNGKGCDYFGKFLKGLNR